MGAEQIDAYLAQVPEPQRAALEATRAEILRLVPDAEQTISYGLPAFRVPADSAERRSSGRSRAGGGPVFGGFAANRDFNSYYPFSGSTLDALADELVGFHRTKSALHFAKDAPLDPALLARLIAVRRAEIDSSA